ncbi:MAG: nitronate monooxygenase family protein [Frisingicoccus sp.]|uniref:NAD(P)H-dependent flavin oxidoreductase n=1 Tax=Frisingicoccus sp. TaxID=1918627 RepID=UPI002638F398|nr:nitronate monooxygenase family protein [Frisingicoccus sp.]MDD6232177.1 nitronate monooxygenase family protein [Frisingicoccus sp.]
MKPLCIGDLTVDIPVVQGGMGVGVSLASLAGAVAAQGGLGVISTAQIGYNLPDFSANPMAANLRAIREQVKSAREKAHGGAIGVNIMVATRNYKDYVLEAVKAGVDIIISGAGLPTALPEYVKGSKTKIAPIVSSEKAAKLICRMWDKRHHCTPDMIVIEGPLAGGHLGFSKDQLVPFVENSVDKISDMMHHYDEEIKKIIQVCREYGEKYSKHIPVVIAGGIDGRKEADHCFALGAEGIQVATPFVATEECDAHRNFKEAYVRAEKEDIVILNSPVGMPARGIKNKFLQNVAAGIKGEIRCRQCLEHCDPLKIPYCITDALIRAVQGDVENGLVFCGANVDKIKRISTVRDVIEKYI